MVGTQLRARQHHTEKKREHIRRSGRFANQTLILNRSLYLRGLTPSKRIIRCEIPYIPGGSSHVDRGTTDRLDQEAVFIAGRHLLALVKIAFGDALNQEVERTGVHLKHNHTPRHNRESKNAFDIFIDKVSSIWPSHKIQTKSRCNLVRTVPTDVRF